MPGLSWAKLNWGGGGIVPRGKCPRRKKLVGKFPEGIIRGELSVGNCPWGGYPEG